MNILCFDGNWHPWEEASPEEQQAWKEGMNAADRYVEERKRLGTVTKTDLSSALLDRAWRQYGIN